jgi:hypothetical protein
MSSKSVFYGAVLRTTLPAVRTALPALAGTAIGLVVGGTYGLLCGLFLGALHHTAQPILAGGMWCALAGAAAGAIMGVCASIDWALSGKRPEPRPGPHIAPQAPPEAVDEETRWRRHNGTPLPESRRAFCMTPRNGSALR